MSFVIADRVRETTLTSGTGPLTLVGATLGYRSLASVLAVGDTCYYGIEEVDGSGVPSGAWEVGLGTYSAANTLTRTTILASSNANAALNLAVGATKNVFITVPATQVGWVRERLAADRTYYVRTPAAAVSFSAGSANVTWAAHGRSVGDAVVLSISPNRGTFTVTIASPGVFTKAGHGYAAGQPLKFATTGALPTGLVAGTTYYVIATGLTTNTFQVSATVGGSAVNTSGSQSGTHYVEQAGAMPTFSTEGLLVAGTAYKVGSVVDANTVTLKNAAGTALGTATLATGSPLYVASTGSDTNDGRTTSTPFLTRQQAADTISNTLDLNGHTATVQLADSTYTSTAQLNPLCGVGTAVMQGNSTSPGNVQVSTTSADAVYATGAGSRWTAKDFRVKTTTFGYGLHTDTFAVLHYGNIEFDSCAVLQIYANTTSTIWCDSNYAIIGGAQAHIQSDFGGVTLCYGKTLTLTNNPAFTSAFVVASVGSMYLVGNTYVGTATGPRYSILGCGVVDSQTTLPGNSTTAPISGGQYI